MIKVHGAGAIPLLIKYGTSTTFIKILPRRKSIDMDRRHGFFTDCDPKGPREIRVDLSVEQLSKHLDFEKGMARKYMDLIKIKLQKEFPHAKVKIGLKSRGDPVWWLSNDDGTALAKCREILAKVDRLNET